nr:hypothetical protein [Candidatus Levybacteria bacterium]
MAQLHIRIARTQELDRVLSYLKKRYSILSESEIIKVALSEKYKHELEE